LTAPVRRAAFTRDGLLVAICTDGTVWAYSTARHGWRCLLTGPTELTQLMFDDTESTAYLFDIDSRIIVVDLTEVRRELGD
jgi:hypothetical protein